MAVRAAQPAVTGQERHVQSLGERHISRVIGCHGLSQLPHPWQQVCMAMPDERDVAEQIKREFGTLDLNFAREGQTPERMRKFHIKQMRRMPFLAEETVSMAQAEGGPEQKL